MCSLPQVAPADEPPPVALGHPSPELGPQEAPEELPGSRRHAGVPQTVAPLDVDELAFPAVGLSPVPLQQLLGRSTLEFVVQGLQDHLLPT